MDIQQVSHESHRNQLCHSTHQNPIHATADEHTTVECTAKAPSRNRMNLIETCQATARLGLQHATAEEHTSMQSTAGTEGICGKVWSTARGDPIARADHIAWRMATARRQPSQASNAPLMQARPSDGEARLAACFLPLCSISRHLPDRR